MGFGKSLLIAVGSTTTAAAAVVGAGLLTNPGLEIWSDTPPPEPEAQRTLVIAPVALDRRGYALAGSQPGDRAFVYVEFVTRRKRDRQIVCRLIPAFTPQS
ncbi:MAG: hypothetical protein VW268_03550 [Rhodospirillaceae bacterium]